MKLAASPQIKIAHLFVLNLLKTDALVCIKYSLQQLFFICIQSNEKCVEKILFIVKNVRLIQDPSFHDAQMNAAA